MVESGNIWSVAGVKYRVSILKRQAEMSRNLLIIKSYFRV